MVSAHSIAIINAKAVEMIRNRLYSDAGILLEAGLVELDGCGWKPEDQCNTCSLHLHTAEVLATGALSMEDSAFAFYGMAFLVRSDSWSSNSEKDDADPISDCEYALLTCVLFYNMGLAWYLSGGTCTDATILAQTAFESAFAYMDQFASCDYPSVILLNLAVLNNTGYMLYHPNCGAAYAEESAEDRLDWMNDILQYSYRRNASPPSEDLVLFMSNMNYHQDKKANASSSAA